jgi:ABC-type branched-subunit amino acid transport system ATPase component/branched-subunit amino acid ABC-type transport system permease component
VDQYALFLVLGLGLGAVYAALAAGIVVTHQGTGVVNFAAAVMGAVPMYVYSDLQGGWLTLPLPFIPRVEVGAMPIALAVTLSLAVAAALGAVVAVVISRPLRHAPVLAKVVAAVGIMATLQAGLGLRYGTEGRFLTPLLPTDTLRIGEASVGTDRIWLVVMVVGLVGAIAVAMKFSRIGLAIQAAAENERAASLAGLSPNLLGVVCWSGASLLVGLVLIVAGPIVGVLSPTSLTLMVIPGLAAALIARLTSVWIALVGGLALGVVQAELQFVSNSAEWWPEWGRQGLSDAVPFVVVVVTLFVLGRRIPMRGDDTTASLPPVILPRNRPIAVVGFTGAGLVVLAFTGGSYRFGVMTSLIMALVAFSLVILTGFLGQVSLAQAAFAGVAGLALSKIGTGLPFPIALLVAAGLASAAGVLVALPALRIRGAQLAVVTFAAALMLQKFVFGNPQVLNPSGDLIPSPSLPGIDLSVREGSNVARFPFAAMVLTVVVIVLVVVGNLLRGAVGRRMLAVRGNERAASSLGIGVARTKLAGFALSSFVAGLGGALIGYSRGQLSAESFGVFVGLAFLAIAYMGGITSISGAVVAGALAPLGIVFVLIDRHLGLGSYYPLFSGLALLATVLLNPVGIAGKTRADLEAWSARRKRGRGGVPTGAARPAPRRGARQPHGVGRSEAAQSGEPLLQARDITVTYGGVVAVDGVNLDVHAGEIVGLIGPNGAGKTSFIDAVTGFTRSRGTVTLRGERLDGQAPHLRARRGLARTWQAGELFDDLSVLANVRVSDDVARDRWSGWRDLFAPRRPPSEMVADAISLLGLDDVVNERPQELSLGRQKAVGVARALALRPSVLLLDEPAAGLDSAESQEFGRQLRAAADTGVGCLLVDHDMHLVLGVCDRLYVVDFGKPVADGPPDIVRRDPAVIAAYLGSDHASSAASEPRPPLTVPAPSSAALNGSGSTAGQR